VFRIEYPDGLVHIMVKACTPELDGHTRLLQQVVRNDAEADRPSADILAFDDKVEGEDQDILDGLPPDYPLAPTAQVHTRVDRPALELRRYYADIISGAWTPEPVA
jgi:vanillate O-demethylase oxygenase-like protein